MLGGFLFHFSDLRLQGIELCELSCPPRNEGFSSQALVSFRYFDFS